MKIVLASQSPRRRELMAYITPDFESVPSRLDESTIHAATPKALVAALAQAKCREVAQSYPDALVIGCDTVVDCNNTVFGKPKDAADARRMLKALSGSTHAVHTGVSLRLGTQTQTFAVTSRVTFFPIPDAEIEAYIATAEPYDKAGAYAIQGRATRWLDRIEGDYYNIMGFPVSRVAKAVAAMMQTP